ncbi:YitT family protein [bacterium]|nr:YitT family protein [bacterium]
MKKEKLSSFKLNSRDIRDLGIILVGATIQAFALNLFMVPANLVSGGVSGVAQVIHHYTNWPIGVMVFVGNIPLFLLGWRYLGGFKFALRTIFSVAVFSIAVDLTRNFVPPIGISNDTLLNALYGGVVSGIGFAIVYRGRGTSGGTDILARIFSHKWSVPISQSYLMTDIFTMFLGGVAFGWEKALYATVMLYTSGISAETVSQGSRVVRTALIISNSPDEVSQEIMGRLGRGVTKMQGTGMYTGEGRSILYCVVSRSEVERLKAIIADTDPNAFMVIGNGYEALGEGFQPIKQE